MRCDHTQWNTSPTWYGERRWEHQPNTMALSFVQPLAQSRTLVDGLHLCCTHADKAGKQRGVAYAMDVTSLTVQGPRASSATRHRQEQLFISEPAERNDAVCAQSNHTTILFMGLSLRSTRGGIFVHPKWFVLYTTNFVSLRSLNH